MDSETSLNPTGDQSQGDYTVSPLNGAKMDAAHRWKPGQSGNPAGRPSAGARVIEAWHNLAGKTVEELQSLANAPNTGWANRVAALQMLKSMDVENDPRNAGDSTDRVLDRTVGKPTQQINVDSHSTQVQIQATASLDGIEAGGLRSLVASLLQLGAAPPERQLAQNQVMDVSDVVEITPQIALSADDKAKD